MPVDLDLIINPPYRPQREPEGAPPPMTIAAGATYIYRTDCMRCGYSSYGEWDGKCPKCRGVPLWGRD